jgi:hypothetical protein
MTLLKWKFNSKTHPEFKNFQLGPMKNDSTTHFDCYVTIDDSIVKSDSPPRGQFQFQLAALFFCVKR